MLIFISSLALLISLSSIDKVSLCFDIRNEYVLGEFNTFGLR